MDIFPTFHFTKLDVFPASDDKGWQIRISESPTGRKPFKEESSHGNRDTEILSLKLTWHKHLKIPGWDTNLSSFWQKAYFQRLLLLVSGRVMNIDGYSDIHREFSIGSVDNNHGATPLPPGKLLNPEELVNGWCSRSRPTTETTRLFE